MAEMGGKAQWTGITRPAQAGAERTRGKAGIRRNAMHKVHRECAPAADRDGLAAVDAAVRAGHLTEVAAEAIIASPLALSKAAEFRRFGGKARK